MSKQAKIIIFSVILFASFLMKHCNEDGSTYERPTSNSPKKNYSDRPSTKERKTNNSTTYYPQPENGFSPYNAYCGQGMYNNSAQNSFIIKNDNSTDAVVLLVDAYSNRKIRKNSIEKLIQSAEQMVKNSGKKYMMSISRSNSLLKVHENLGWQVDNTPSHEMVKIL